MGGEGQQVDPEPLEREIALRYELGGIAMDHDAALAGGLGNLDQRLKRSHLTLGSGQGRQPRRRRQQLIELVEPHHPLPIDRPFSNAPPLGLELVSRSDHRWMLHCRDHHTAWSKTRGTAEEGEMDGFSRPRGDDQLIRADTKTLSHTPAGPLEGLRSCQPCSMETAGVCPGRLLELLHDRDHLRQRRCRGGSI